MLPWVNSAPPCFQMPRSFSGSIGKDLHCLALPLTSRRSSEKRSQAAADLEDILMAFTKLDEVDKILCEACELVKLPPISVDPIGEMISGNAASLKLLDDKISQIQDDHLMASLLSLSLVIPL